MSRNRMNTLKKKKKKKVFKLRLQFTRSGRLRQ
jgi:hypothetical protein